MRIKIVSCKNKFLWYRQEAEKPKKEKRVFSVIKCEDSYCDKIGVVIPNIGFVYWDDCKIVK